MDIRSIRFDSTSRPIGKIGTFRCRKLVYLQRVHYGSELRFSGFSLILKVSGKERRRSLCYWFLFCLPSHHSWCQSPWGFDTLPLFTGIKFDNYFYYTTLLIFGWKGSPFQEGQWLRGGRGASSKNGSLEVTKKQSDNSKSGPIRGFHFQIVLSALIVRQGGYPNRRAKFRKITSTQIPKVFTENCLLIALISNIVLRPYTHFCRKKTITRLHFHLDSM